MVVKGTRKLNKAISAVLAPFGIAGAKLSDEYSYHYDTEKIYYKVTENAIEDIWFLEFIEERFGYKPKYPFVMSLLHEVGHHEANDEIEGALLDFCLMEKQRIAEEMETADDEESKKLEWQYFNLPDEIMATAWAVNFSKNNPDMVEQMWTKMRKAFYKFYTANGLDIAEGGE